MAVDPLTDAVQWAHANPEAFDQIVEWALEDIAHGQRPSMKLYGELLRRPYFANRLRLQRSDVQFRLNNNLLSDLARLCNRLGNLGFVTRSCTADRWEAKNE